MSKKRNSFVILIVLAIFLLPIAFYSYQFGFGVWSSHQKWAEMGTSFSGIYSPIIAFLGFVILIGQFNLQKVITKHQFDMSFIQDNKSELSYYLDKMSDLLKAPMVPEGNAINILKTIVVLEESDLRRDAYKEVCLDFYNRNQLIFDIWLAIQPILVGLDSQKEIPYQHSHTSSYLRITTMISFECCIALDKVLFSINPKVTRQQLRFWTEEST